MKNPVLHFFLLKQRVTFDSALSCVDKSLGVIKIFLKKSLEMNPSYGSYLTPIFMLVPVETNPPIKKKVGKWDVI